MQTVIDDEARKLGARFATIHHSPVQSIGWIEHDNGDAEVCIRLRDAHDLRGRGPGKLEALVEAEAALGAIQLERKRG